MMRMDARMLRRYRMLALAMGASAVADILATHSSAIIKGHVHKNPYFVEPDEYLERLRDRSA